MAATNVKEAVALAKQEVTNLFADEGAENIGLEEVEYDDAFKNWRITIGFSPLSRKHSLEGH